MNTTTLNTTSVLILDDLFNIENSTIKDKFMSKLSPVTDGLLLISLCAFGIIALALNFSIVLTSYIHHKILRPLDYFVANIALCDVVMLLTMYPLLIISLSKQKWSFGEMGCRIYGFIGHFTAFSSIYTLATLAVIRYLFLRHVHLKAYLLKKQLIAGIVSGIYIFFFDHYFATIV